MTEKITKRQQAVLDVIEQCIREKGFGPTVREVCQALGLSSPSTVHVHLKALEEKGLIKRDALKSRSIALTYPLDHTEDATNIIQAQFDDIVSVPLVGDVAAGVPILAEQNIEDTFTIPTEIATDQGSFILEVHGNSMINVGIYNGDYIIVREQKSAMNGEIVVAMIDGSATVKTFYKEQGRVRLQPENDTMEPIYATNPTILGRVVGLMRRFS